MKVKGYMYPQMKKPVQLGQYLVDSDNITIGSVSGTQALITLQLGQYLVDRL